MTKDNSWIIEVDITHKCNIRCRHCNRLCNDEKNYHTQRSTLFMNEKHIDYLCSQIRKYPKGKVRMVRVLGGEPLLSPIIIDAIRKFEALKFEGFVKEIRIMSNGTIEIPTIIRSYIINHPPRVQDLVKKKGKLMAEEVYEAKDERHVNITITPSDFNESVNNICDRYIGCGIHYTIYGFSLTASCFPSLFVFSDNHRYFRHDLPPSAKDLFDENFVNDVCSVCVYGLNSRDERANILFDSAYVGEHWARQIRQNKRDGFSEPDINWIEEVCKGLN